MTAYELSLFDVFIHLFIFIKALDNNDNGSPKYILAIGQCIFSVFYVPTLGIFTNFDPIAT